jgi:Flp pilus assembly protein TadD
VIRRVIQGAAIALEQTARAHLSENQFATAATHFEAILMLQPDRASLYIDLARARILDGDKKAATAALKSAFAAGSRDFKRVETDDAFKPLRNDPAYLEVLASMRNASTATDIPR